MKALDWQRSLESLRRLHGKTVFTITELAHLSGSSPQVLNVELGRLQKQQVIVRYAQGRYGLPDVVTPQALLPHLDGEAYITGAFALYQHNLITQSIREVCCFTSRRHNRSRVRETPVGRLVFVCVQAPVYAPPADGAMASPEQALCDFVFLSRRSGLDPLTLVTFRGLDRLDQSLLAEVAARYPATTRETIERLM